MMRHIFRPSGNIFLLVLVLFGSACFSVAAYPAGPPNVVAGCNQDVWNALVAKSNAQVAYDAAVTREMINKPDSVLTLTCFDQAAGISAKTGGNIFSGDFTPDLQNIMRVTYPAGGNYACAGIGDLWNKIVTTGVDNTAPYATFDDLMTGNYPAGTVTNLAIPNDFRAGWDAANTANVFSGLQTAVNNAVPQINPPVNYFNGPNPAKSSCDVLIKAGIINGNVGDPCP